MKITMVLNITKLDFTTFLNYMKIYTLNISFHHHHLGDSNKSPDFAILVLKEKVVPNKYVKIADLPRSDATCPKGKRLIVSGWGLDMHHPTRNINRLSAVLQECLPQEKCEISEKMKPFYLCVGDSKQPRNSACNGDSGGNFL